MDYTIGEISIGEIQEIMKGAYGDITRRIEKIEGKNHVKYEEFKEILKKYNNLVYVACVTGIGTKTTKEGFLSDISMLQTILKSSTTLEKQESEYEPGIMKDPLKLLEDIVKKAQQEPISRILKPNSNPRFLSQDEAEALIQKKINEYCETKGVEISFSAQNLLMDLEEEVVGVGEPGGYRRYSEEIILANLPKFLKRYATK